MTPTGLQFLSQTPAFARSPIIYPLQPPTLHTDQDQDRDPLNELSQLADEIATCVLENTSTRTSKKKKQRATFQTVVKRVKRAKGKRK